LTNTNLPPGHTERNKQKKWKLRLNDLDVNLVILIIIKVQYTVFHENLSEMWMDETEHSLYDPLIK
jgi:hypothetical protein